MTYSNISFKTAKLLAKLDFDWWTEKSLIKTNSGEEYIVDSKLPIDYPNTYKFIAPIPSLGKLHDWLFERHNIEVNVRKHVSLDLFCEPENGGTGQVLPEHYNGNAKSYKKAYDKGLRRGLKILLKSQQNGDV
jgi:hypothetical protein